MEHFFRNMYPSVQYLLAHLIFFCLGSLSLLVLLSLCHLVLRHEAACRNIPTLTAARPGWVTLNEVSGSSLPTSVTSLITGFSPFSSVLDWPHIQALHSLTKDSAENFDLFFPPAVVKIVLNLFLPLAQSQMTTDGQVSAKKLPASVKGWNLTRHW